MGKESKLDSFIDKSVDLLFSRNSLYLLIIFFVALILRIIAAVNLNTMADDMHFVTHAINFLFAGRLVTYDQSAGLWFAFTNLMYSFFGLTQLASRLAAVIFGSCSTIVIYLITREFFTQRISLFSAFLLAIDPFSVKSTMAEMDVMVMFFVLLSIFLFTKALKSSKLRMYFLSGISLGLGLYTKVYALLFVPTLLLFYIYHTKKNKEKVISKKSFKRIFVFGLAILIFAIPSLAHNWLLYESKGFVDLQFTREFDIGRDISAQYYSFDPIFSQDHSSNSWKALIFGGPNSQDASGLPLLFVAARYVWLIDPIMTILSFIGIIILGFSYKKLKNEKQFIFLSIFSVMFILPFLASIIHLTKHYLFLAIFLIPYAAITLSSLSNAIERVIKKRSAITVCLIYGIVMLIYLGMPTQGVAAHMYGESYVGNVIDFKDHSIPQDALVIADGRFYRGQIDWMLQGRHYLEAPQFMEIMSNQDKVPGKSVPTDVYYIECVIGDCGWGTIASQPEFNKSMGDLADNIRSQSTLVADISVPSTKNSYYPFISGKDKLVETVRIYKLTMLLKDGVIQIADQPKNWFLYNIGYPPSLKEFDSYSTDGALEVLVNLLAHGIVILATILALLAPFYTFYLLIKQKSS